MSVLHSDEWSNLGLRHPWQSQYPKCVPISLEYPSQPLGWLLEDSATHFPDRIACRYYEQKVSYRDLLTQARRFAAVLRREGLKPGDRVGVLLPNIPEYLVALFGTWMAGGVVVALSPLMVASTASALAKSTGCRIVVTLDVLLPLVCSGAQQPDLVFLTSLSSRMPRLARLGYAWVRFRRIGFRRPRPGTKLRDFQQALEGAAENLTAVAIDVESPAYILPTGGTTGAPKAVVLSHRNLMANACQLSRWSLGRSGEETILAVIPFFHCYGLSTCVLSGVSMGATLVMHHRFRPASVVPLIEKHRPSVIFAVPAMLSALNAVVL